MKDELGKIFDGIVQARDYQKAMNNGDDIGQDPLSKIQRNMKNNINSPLEKIPLVGQLFKKSNSIENNMEDKVYKNETKALNKISTYPFRKKEEKLAKEWSLKTGQPFPYIREGEVYREKGRKDISDETFVSKYRSDITDLAYRWLVINKKLTPEIKDAEHYLNTEEFGIVLNNEVIKNDPIGFAKSFSEGNKSLEKLLLSLWDNNIQTHGCCAGHSEPSHHYYKDRGILPAVEITADEYYENIGQKKYHHREKMAPGYISFNTPELDVSQTEYKEILENAFQEKGISATISIDANMTNINRKNYTNDIDASNFFDIITTSISTASKDFKKSYNVDFLERKDTLISNVNISYNKDNEISKAITEEISKYKVNMPTKEAVSIMQLECYKKGISVSKYGDNSLIVELKDLKVFQSILRENKRLFTQNPFEKPIKVKNNLATSKMMREEQSLRRRGKCR